MSYLHVLLECIHFPHHFPKGRPCVSIFHCETIACAQGFLIIPIRFLGIMILRAGLWYLRGSVLVYGHVLVSHEVRHDWRDGLLHGLLHGLLDGLVRHVLVRHK